MQYAYLVSYRGKQLASHTVRVLGLRRNTAHIEARRANGQLLRRYVKRSRLRFL
jgi:hypothetical protein